MADKNHHEMVAKNLARYIGEVALPIARETRHELVPGECNNPPCWIKHCADGVAQSGAIKADLMATKITAAFRHEYGVNAADAFDHVDNLQRKEGRER